MLSVVRHTSACIIIIIIWPTSTKPVGVNMKLSNVQMVATTCHSDVSVCWKDTAFPLWRAMDMRWNKNVVSLVSSVILLLLLLLLLLLIGCLQANYDAELLALHELVQQKVSTLLSDPDNIVKRTLLTYGIKRLCVFFGRQKGSQLNLSCLPALWSCSMVPDLQWDQSKQISLLYMLVNIQSEQWSL